MSFVISIMFNVITRIDEMLGRGVLAKFFTGYYYRPREEERIFMFLDLAGSTELAERNRSSCREARSTIMWAMKLS